MNQKIHFISGLPRSGSTLLAGILRQNPRFHAAMTSPVGALFNTLVETMSPGIEFAVFITEEQRRDILEGLFTTFYRKEAHRMFQNLQAGIQHDIVHTVYHVGIVKETPPESKQPVGAGKKVGRNDPCPCGSGKKYKRCCGR